MRKRILITVFALLVAISFSVTSTIHAERKEKQPHMEAAIEHLKAAQKEMAAATHDKGGHLTNAENFTNRAIQELEAGIKYADEHRK